MRPGRSRHSGNCLSSSTTSSRPGCLMPGLPIARVPDQPECAQEARPAWHGAAVGAGQASTLRAHHDVALRCGEPTVAQHAQDCQRGCGWLDGAANGGPFCCAANWAVTWPSPITPTRRNRCWALPRSARTRRFGSMPPWFTSLDNEILTLGQLYRHRADCGSVFDELNNNGAGAASRHRT
jgi:hypothetical protein